MANFLILKNRMNITNEAIKNAVMTKSSTMDISIFHNYETLFKEYYEPLYHKIDVDDFYTLNNLDIGSLKFYNEVAYNREGILKLMLDIDIKRDDVTLKKTPIDQIARNYYKEIKQKNGEETFMNINDNNVTFDEFYLLETLIDRFIEYMIREDPTFELIWNYSSSIICEDETNNNTIVSNRENEDEEDEDSESESDSDIEELVLDNINDNVAPKQSKLLDPNNNINLKDKNSIFEFIKKNISVTKSTSGDKFSYHIYFNSLYYHTTFIRDIKKIIIGFKSIVSHPFMIGVDSQIYKDKTSIRIPFALKAEKKIDYHYPIRMKRDGKIVHELELLNSKNLNNYFFSFNDIKELRNKKYFLITKKEIPTITTSELTGFTIDTSKAYNAAQSSPDAHFLTPSSILHLIFSSRVLTRLETTGKLQNIKDFNSREFIFREGSNKALPNLIFDYDKEKGCFWCKKHFHKNIHTIIPVQHGISIVKEGYRNNCFLTTIAYEPLSEQNICKYVFDKGCVKKVNDGQFAIFNKTYGWQLVEENGQQFKQLVNSFIDSFKHVDQITLGRMSVKVIKEHFESFVADSSASILEKPYLYKFDNGILDMRDRKLYKFNESEDLLVFTKANYNYKGREEYNEEDKNKESFILKVLDEILPVKNKDGKFNKNREVFEQNISTSLINDQGKDVITICVGGTMAGKTTTKELIISALGIETSIILPIELYTGFISPSKPNPWLAGIRNKKLSFASEASAHDTYKSQSIKLITESVIVSRALNSNEGHHTLKATQFIDTNHEPVLDQSDPASYRRLAVVKFLSHFKKNEVNLLEVNYGEQNNYPCKETLKTDIMKGKYNYIMFNILLDWAHKYDHFNGIKMANTASSFPESSLNICINSLCYAGTRVSYDDIDPDSRHYYQQIKIPNSGLDRIILCMKPSYFKSYFERFVQYYNWAISIDTIVKKLSVGTNSDHYIILVLLKDIDKTKRMSFYESYKKKYTDSNVSMEYYLEHGHVGEPDLMNVQDHEAQNEEDLGLLTKASEEMSEL